MRFLLEQRLEQFLQFPNLTPNNREDCLRYVLRSAVARVLDERWPTVRWKLGCHPNHAQPVNSHEASLRIQIRRVRCSPFE
jgi:hypothetical protein